MFGKFLQYLLDKHNFKQIDLHRMSGISTANISHAIQGKPGYQNPTLETIGTYAKALGMTAAGFIREYENWKAGK